jgi:hypothetical protein
MKKFSPRFSADITERHISRAIDISSRKALERLNASTTEGKECDSSKVLEFISFLHQVRGDVSQKFDLYRSLNVKAAQSAEGN